MSVWAWIQQVQVAAAFIIAHLDQGWEGSLRKSALCSIARGPMDWTVGAAVTALAQVAREEPATAPSIAQLYLEMLNALPRPGGIPYLNALIVCAGTLPAVSPPLQEQLKRALMAAS